MRLGYRRAKLADAAQGGLVKGRVAVGALGVEDASLLHDELQDSGHALAFERLNELTCGCLYK